MRLRTLLTTAVVGALIAGGTGMTAQAAPVAAPERAGTVVPWGDTANAQAAAAMAVPDGLTVAAMATTSRSTAVVTADGQLRVWGVGDATEVTEYPRGVTDAVAVALTLSAGLVLHRDGTVTGWGSQDIAEKVPGELRAKAIAIGQTGAIAYAVRTDGTLARWGQDAVLPAMPLPESGLTDLEDVAADQQQVLALRADGTVVAWGFAPQFGQAAVPGFGDREVEQIVAGPTANGAVLDDGTIEVWGTTPPADEPDFAGTTGGAGETVVSLSLGANAGAVTADGAVHTWGSTAAINDNAPDTLGEPVASIAVGNKHAAVIVTSFRAVTDPTVTGTPQVGQTLTATPATFSLAPDSPATGQWYAGATPIAGQAGTTLALDESMLDKSISYRSTATRDGETVTSDSNVLGPVTAVPQPPGGDDEPAAKAKSKIKKVKVKAKGNKKVAKKVKIVVAVKAAQGTSPKGGKVVVALKGKTKKKAVAKVNAKGKAKVLVKKVKRGKYQVKLKYRGNADVAPAKKTIKKVRI